MDKSKQFLIRLILIFVGIVLLVIVARDFMIPDSWGEYGYYRGDYINEEASREIKYGTNLSCMECHQEVNELKSHSAHQRLSCEMCHAPVSEHILDGKKIAMMPTKQGEPQIELCLQCHQKTVGRDEKIPTIDHKQHLDEQEVKATHSCDQCHTVHAPLENMKHVKKMRTLREVIDEQ